MTNFVVFLLVRPWEESLWLSIYDGERSTRLPCLRSPCNMPPPRAPLTFRKRRPLAVQGWHLRRDHYGTGFNWSRYPRCNQDKTNNGRIIQVPNQACGEIHQPWRCGVVLLHNQAESDTWWVESDIFTCRRTNLSLRSLGGMCMCTGRIHSWYICIWMSLIHCSLIVRPPRDCDCILYCINLFCSPDILRPCGR